MRQSLALVTPPATEPVTLTEAKAWCHIDGTDDDATITILIAAARAAAEEYLRRSLITQSWKLTLDLSTSQGGAWSDGVYNLPVTALYGSLPKQIPLPREPVSSITSVTTYDLTDTPSVFAPSNYRVDASGGRMILTNGASWSSNIRPQAGCEIVYVAGYGNAGAVPKPIKTGILIHLASLYEQRGLCEDAMDLPPGAAQLYRSYRIMDYRRA